MQNLHLDRAVFFVLERAVYFLKILTPKSLMHPMFTGCSVFKLTGAIGLCILVIEYQ